MKNYSIGKTGNINDIDGLEIYLFDDSTVVATIKLHNFDFLPYLQTQIYDILPDETDLNNSNCILGFGLFINENYRKQGLGKKMLELSFEECKNYNIINWLGYRSNDNKITEKMFNNLNLETIVKNENIEVYIKKI